MKTPLNLCYTAKKGRQRSKNLHRILKYWARALDPRKELNLELNPTEKSIFYTYLNRIMAYMR